MSPHNYVLVQSNTIDHKRLNRLGSLFYLFPCVNAGENQRSLSQKERMMERFMDVLVVQQELKSKHCRSDRTKDNDQNGLLHEKSNTKSVYGLKKDDFLTEIEHNTIEHLESNHRTKFIRSNPLSSSLSSDENYKKSLSLGSSMSLGSSTTGQSTTTTTMAAATQQNAFFPHHQASQATYFPQTASSSSSVANTMNKPMKKRSPRRVNQEGLGAAMGTMLNSKSPGLAAKMNTTQYMDMSPIPVSRTSHGGMISATNLLQQTPSRSSQSFQADEDENLPPGSAMKIDSPISTQENATLNLANEKNARRKAGSLGRLFGTELSQHCSTQDLEGYKTMPLGGGPSNATKHASLGCVFGGGESDTLTSKLNPKMITPQDMSVSMDSSSLLAIGDYSVEDASPSIHCRIRQQNHSSKQPSPKTQQPKLPKIHLPTGFDAQGSPVNSTARPNLFRRPSKDDSSPLGYGKKFASFNARSGTSAALAMGYNLDTTQGSPRSPASISRNSAGLAVGANDQQFMPGFGASEREGKILPCFSVKDDGLMRITAETLLNVLGGEYDQQMDGYQIIDCRFGYEFEGGHIQGAINLSTMDKVKRHFLQPEMESSIDESCPTSSSNRCLPPRSQSGKADLHGNKRKKVLIFHCEFSLKRAPSSALALRQADRALAHDYPNCHFPEVYVLQGGYSGFFTRFSGKACEPKAYVQMDDPQFQQNRSIELNGFRKQFSRHRSFTYGDSRQVNSDSNLMMPPPQQTNQRGAHQKAMTNYMIKEEDSSFDQSGGSPSALQASALMARRKGLMRHATASCALGSAPNLMTTNSRNDSLSTTSSSSLGMKPVLTNRMRSVQEGGEEKPVPTCVGDLSFDDSCSIGDDSITSFDGENGINDSPCAAATASSHSRRLPALAPGPRPPMMTSFSTSAARLPQFRAPRRTASSNSFVPAMSPMER